MYKIESENKTFQKRGQGRCIAEWGKYKIPSNTNAPTPTANPLLI